MSDQLVKWITSFRSIGRSGQRGRAHGPVIPGKTMSVYTDLLFYWWWKKTSFIYHHSPSYNNQSCEIPVRGKEYLEGSRGGQRIGENTKFLSLKGWKGGRYWGSTPTNVSSVSLPLISMLKADITNGLPQCSLLRLETATETFLL